MILQIEFQHVIRTNEQSEIKLFEFKSIIRTSEGDQTDYWNIADPAPDFGCRQFVYVWFEHIPDNAIKEIEAFTPSPLISFWNNGWTEYRNFIKLSVLPDSAVQELQLKEARQLSKQLDLKYQNWQKELAETQTAASPKIFPFQIYQYVSELVEVKSILEQSPKSSPNPAVPSSSAQLQENEVDEADGDWIRADVWAANHSKVDGRPSKSMKELILGNLSSARERSEETQNKYKGRNILKDGAGREYFKISYRVCYYKKKQLENDREFLTSHNH